MLLTGFAYFMPKNIRLTAKTVLHEKKKKKKKTY